MNLKINLSKSAYDIFIENNLIDNLNSYIERVYSGTNIYIITDDIVAPLYLARVIKALDSFKLDYVIIKAGECSKVIDSYINISTILLDKGIRRGDLLLALGGGVIGDITGFIASTLYRGIPYINIPTSLLAQMDSSIGGKTGIDFYNRKNILGSFYQPSLVLIDPLCLNTLPKREFNNGMGELIKHGFIGNPKLIDYLNEGRKIDEEMIYLSLLVKKEIVERDEFDTGDRMLLNFGHTFAHAIELKYGYKHGEAVALGIIMALHMGIDLGITKASLLDKAYDILNKYELPAIDLDYKEFLADAIYDKKNIRGVISFILLKDIGSPLIYKISEDKIKELVNEGKN